MLEAVEVLVPLLKGETVTRKTDWFELNEARVQLQPYTKPMINMAIASQTSPAGARTAGIYGLGLLSISATFAGGFNALATNWEVYARKAKEHRQTVERSNWSLVGPVHIAESREQAFDNVRYGLQDWLQYVSETTALSALTTLPTVDAAQALVDSGMAVIGTADDAVQQIQRLQEGSGGFGSFLQLAHNWADWDQTQRSYALFAERVSPKFTSSKNSLLAVANEPAKKLAKRPSKKPSKNKMTSKVPSKASLRKK
jgi:limonene 1,2-monooxygenase